MCHPIRAIHHIARLLNEKKNNNGKAESIFQIYEWPLNKILRLNAKNYLET